MTKKKTNGPLPNRVITKWQCPPGFSLTPNMESQTPTFSDLGRLIFQRNLGKRALGHLFSKS